LQVLQIVRKVPGTYRVTFYPYTAILRAKCSPTIGNIPLKQAFQPGNSRSGAALRPLLLETDAHGEVIWMSDYARAILGNPANLVDAVPAKSAFTVQFWRVWKAGETQVIGCQHHGGAEFDSEDERALSAIEGNLLRHYFLLHRAERNLFARARELQPGSGVAGVRQLEMERQRLARELHTGVGQLLASIRLQVEIIEKDLPKLPENIRKGIGRMGALAGESLEQVRTISKRLHPPEWQRLKLETALEQLWEMSGMPQRFEAVAHIEPLLREPALETKALLYRAAQEALSNIMRHSRAARVELTLRTWMPLTPGGRIVLTVRDNGVGFKAAALLSAAPRISSGIGLRSIREQAAALGGTLEIESGPGGTTLNVLAPYTANET
jgi:signal transduction histidine kinase